MQDSTQTNTKSNEHKIKRTHQLTAHAIVHAYMAVQHRFPSERMTLLWPHLFCTRRQVLNVTIVL